MSSPRTRARRSSGRPNQARFHASACRAVSSSIRGLGGDQDRRSGRAGGISTASRAVTYRPSRSARPERIRRDDDGQRLLESAHLVIRGVPERVEFGVARAAPDTQDQPPAAHVVEGGRHLGEQPGVAQAGAHDERPELDPARRFGDAGQDRPDSRIPLVSPSERKSRWSKTQTEFSPAPSAANATSRMNGYAVPSFGRSSSPSAERSRPACASSGFRPRSAVRPRVSDASLLVVAAS